MKHVYPLLVALLLSPLGAAAGVLVGYGLLAMFMPENQGRRGLLAGVLGIPIGLVAGFIGGYTLAAWIRDGGAGLWGRTAAGVALAVPSCLLVAAAGLVVGIHLAESRGVSNYAGERAAWGLFYVAMPAGVLAAGVAFVSGRAFVP